MPRSVQAAPMVAEELQPVPQVRVLKRGKVTAEAREAISQVALARLSRGKIPSDAQLCEQFGLSKACIHRIMQAVKLSVTVELSDTAPQPASDIQTASESAMPL